MTAHLFVTGASGTLGGALVRHWQAEGRSIHAFVREGSRTDLFDESSARVHRGDLRDETAVRRAIRLAAQDAERAGEPLDVVHAGALISYRTRDAEESRVSNVKGTRHVVESSAQCRVRRLLFVSSVVAVGVADSAEGALDEDAEFNGSALACPYVTTKRAAEDFALAATPDLQVVVANPGAIYGPSPRISNTTRFLLAVRDGALGPLLPPGSMGVVGLDDVVAGCAAALELGRDRRRYILNESNWLISEVVALARAAWGLPAQSGRRCPPALWSVAVAGAGLVDRFRALDGLTPQSMRLLGEHFRFDGARARAELNWKPAPFADVLRRTVEWLRHSAPADLEGARAS